MSSTRSERVPPLAVNPAPPQRAGRMRGTALGRHAPDRPALGKSAIVLVAVVAVAAGVLGMRVDRGGHEAAALGEVISIPNGEMRVDAVRYWNEGQHAGGMPGMKISDPLPKGFRRFWVDVTLRASSSPGIRYVPEAFTVSADEARAVSPHWALDGLSTIVPGAQATVTLMYQVPKETGDILLALGDSRAVTVPGPNGPAHADDGH